jgi:hypothetical protein
MLSPRPVPGPFDVRRIEHLIEVPARPYAGIAHRDQHVTAGPDVLVVAGVALVKNGKAGSR